MLSDLSTEYVSIAYADMARMNKVRAWAKKNRARVDVSRYAKDAYEGRIILPSPWNEGRDAHQERVSAAREMLARLGVREKL